MGGGHRYEFCGWHVVQVAGSGGYLVRGRDGHGVVWGGICVMGLMVDIAVPVMDSGGRLVRRGLSGKYYV